MFQTKEEIKREFEVVKKIPYNFSYKFKDDSGKDSTLMITDWEIGALYFKCLKLANNNEKIAIDKVKEKYFNEFVIKGEKIYISLLENVKSEQEKH